MQHYTVTVTVVKMHFYSFSMVSCSSVILLVQVWLLSSRLNGQKGGGEEKSQTGSWGLAHTVCLLVFVICLPV